ncbi:uncharacterized protein LOC129001769 [Macrosteles quadrilineatus]|uniref:uncharacterized protein LOC129001769 n=1 Tax=Macrosteles quadrilineatus TaxID=74068 RepID=UPI0023E10DEE|nr:uncharacterized protein LOC129001769 [Macrosteles quadrilineatus]
MEVQNDHGLLVVSLENCITSDPCELGKTNSCVYTSGACGPETSVVQLTAPVQCIGDIRQTLSSRMQHQHLTQLQPIQYSQTISYEPNQQMEHNSLVTNHTLYQPMTVSTTPLHTYTTSNPYMNNPVLPLLTPSPSFPSSAPTMEDMATSTDLSEPAVILKTPLELSEPTYPAEGFDYFLEIQKFLISGQCPPNVSENYAKSLKKRAQNYLIINDKLYHKSKQPKEVIMRKDQQEDMLSDIHVVKETGVHLGVKKMFNKLNMKYFWRGMYTDVVNFVKKCDKCSDQIDPMRGPLHPCPGGPTLGMAALGGESEDSDAVEDPSPLSPSPSPASPLRGVRESCNNGVGIWRKVEVQLHGPYATTTGHNEYIATLSDPDSGWCCARPCPACEHSEFLSDFIFHEFCNFGFARCSLVGCSQELVLAVNEDFVAKASQLGDMFTSATIDSVDQQQSSCSWVEPLMERLVQAHPCNWDQYLDLFLFQYRIGELKEFLPFSYESPFSLLFKHNPLSFTLLDQDKENVDGNNTYKLRRRKPHNRLLQCRHCDTLFTSKLSFRIHQRKHQGEGYRRLLNKKRLNKSRETNNLKRPNVQLPGTWKESTVSAVKALLEATKDERRRRGKYHKYSVELQEQMVEYAVKNGNTAAAKYFSERLGTLVNESTIRNLVKIYSAFTPSAIDEIGRFAVNYGVEPAAKFFSERLKRDISQGHVRKFKATYLSRRPASEQKQSEESMFPEDRRNVNPIRNNESRVKRYTVKMKLEIGEYAVNHSVKDTVEHFTEKLQMPVKERTVRRFHEMYLDKFQSQNEEASQNIQSMEPMSCGNQETVHVNVYSTFPETQNNPVTLYQLNQPQAGNNICYQTAANASVITTQSNYHSLQNFSSSIPVTLPTAPPPYPIAVIGGRINSEKPSNVPDDSDNQQAQSSLVPQHSLVLTNQDRGGPFLPHFLASQPLQPTILTLISEKEPLKVSNRSEMQPSFTSECYQENLPVVTELMTHPAKHDVDRFNSKSSVPVPVVTKLVTHKKHEILERLDSKSSDFSDSEKPPDGKRPNAKKQTKKKDKGSKKRGTYTTYSPEVRAEIGKFAAEHGSLKACQHFANILGHDVPESTVRGLREKYLMKKKHCQVTSLGYSQRGRPLRLGKYDELVQECIKDLVRSGEKVSSFLAIATAKEILNKYEPGLLEENGGSLKLNITWAKSFLKRIGVHNNS